MRRRPARATLPQLDRLRRRAEVRALARAARECGAEAWIVGGAVRDALLGLPEGDSAPPEIDAAVAGDAEDLARALEAAGAGRAVFLSRDRPGPRVFRIAGRRPFDVAEIEGGSIEADLGRRDFTVNAVAVSLADGTVLDPHGGLADLARRRLRPVRASNLVDDPLRALRAARLLATRGLVPDRTTLAAARAAAPRLTGVAAERIGAEISRLLGGPRAAPAIAWAGRAGILPPALGRPGLLDSAGIRRIVRTLRRLDDPATVRRPEESRRRRRLAAIALALGLDSAEARRWLAALRLPRRESDAAALLADLAGRPPGLGTRRDQKEQWRWILQAGPLASEAVQLITRIGSSRARRAAAPLRRLVRKPVRRVSVSGHDVVQWLSLQPGPRIGELLSELAVAAACGQVRSRREARNWLTGQVRNASEPL